MPEGPEVKNYVDKITSNFVNKKLLKIHVRSGRYKKSEIKNINSLFNKTLASVNCKGKFIWFDFIDCFLFSTLGMTGMWSKHETNHTRVTFEFENNSFLHYNDIRNFGTLKVCNLSDLKKKLKSIGPDMLSAPPNIQEFVSIIRKNDNKNICTILMSQNILSGIGNYIKAESLWYSRINPHAQAKDLTDSNLITLYHAIIFVINRSYKSMGASFKSYKTFDNEKGMSTFDFCVYGRKHDANGYEVIKEKTGDKRTTHWVKERQIYGLNKL